MGEIKTLESYLIRLGQGAPPNHLKPAKPVFVMKAAPGSSADGTKPIKAGESDTLAMVIKPGYTHPWSDRSVLLLHGQGQDTYSVGRSDNAGLTIPFPTVSKDHGILSGSGDQWQVKDVGSTNGTGVSKDGNNYQKLRTNCDHQLTSQEWVRFGTVETQFFLPEDFVRYVRYMDDMYTRVKAKK